MLHIEPTAQPPIRRSGASNNPRPAEPARDWQMLLLEVQRGLRLGAEACLGGDDDTLAARVHERLIGSLIALEHLQKVLQRVATRCEQLELGARDALVAFAAARAELSGAQDSERRTRYQSLHDTLTALPNSRFFRERLTYALLQPDPLDLGLSVFYLDLDGFQSINDLYGRETGDELLKIVSYRLCRGVRREDMVSRLGGDEFACLRQGLHERQQLAELASKLQQVIAAPITIGALRLTITASIGIAVSPEDGNTAAALLLNAEAAMYCAKHAHSCFAFFESAAAIPSRFAAL